jgi:hypothetical protein
MFFRLFLHLFRLLFHPVAVRPDEGEEGESVGFPNLGDGPSVFRGAEIE